MINYISERFGIRKPLLYVLLAALLAIVLKFLVFDNIVAIREKRTEIDSLNENIASMQERIDAFTLTQQVAESVSGEGEKKEIPDTYNYGTYPQLVLSDISVFAGENNLDILSFQPQKNKIRSLFNSRSYELSLYGYYGDFITWLEDMEELPYYVNLNNLYIAKKDLQNEEFLEIFREFSSVSAEDFSDTAGPVLVSEKYQSASDLRSLIAFKESFLGSEKNSVGFKEELIRALQEPNGVSAATDFASEEEAFQYREELLDQKEAYLKKADDLIADKTALAEYLLNTGNVRTEDPLDFLADVIGHKRLSVNSQEEAIGIMFSLIEPREELASDMEQAISDQEKLLAMMAANITDVPDLEGTVATTDFSAFLLDEEVELLQDKEAVLESYEEIVSAKVNIMERKTNLQADKERLDDILNDIVDRREAILDYKLETLGSDIPDNTIEFEIAGKEKMIDDQLAAAETLRAEIAAEERRVEGMEAALEPLVILLNKDLETLDLLEAGLTEEREINRLEPSSVYEEVDELLSSQLDFIDRNEEIFAYKEELFLEKDELLDARQDYYEKRTALLPVLEELLIASEELQEAEDELSEALPEGETDNIIDTAFIHDKIEKLEKEIEEYTAELADLQEIADRAASDLRILETKMDYKEVLLQSEEDINAYEKAMADALKTSIDANRLMIRPAEEVLASKEDLMDKREKLLEDKESLVILLEEIALEKAAIVPYEESLRYAKEELQDCLDLYRSAAANCYEDAEHRIVFVLTVNNLSLGSEVPFPEQTETEFRSDPFSEN